MPNILELKNIHQTYKNEEGVNRPVLNDVDFMLQEGTCRAILGMSGCGKTTLCRIMAGIEKPSGGLVRYKGEKINWKSISRNKIQMVFQNSLDAVPEYMTSYEILKEPLKNFFKCSKEEIWSKIVEMLKAVGLSEEYTGLYPRQLSGGELQRICILRALMAEPEILILDESLSGLDIFTENKLLNYLSDIKVKKHLSIIFISHSIESAYYIADGITVMDKGRIIEEIDDISLFSELCHPFTSRLMHGLPISVSAMQDYNFYLERFKKGDTRLVTVKPGHRIEL